MQVHREERMGLLLPEAVHTSGLALRPVCLPFALLTGSLCGWSLLSSLPCPRETVDCL